jgi:hypothetical protein
MLVDVHRLGTVAKAKRGHQRETEKQKRRHERHRENDFGTGKARRSKYQTIGCPAKPGNSSENQTRGTLSHPRTRRGFSRVSFPSYHVSSISRPSCVREFYLAAPSRNVSTATTTSGRSGRVSPEKTQRAMIA